jgi:anaerobic magnesium-protoporphyrin IX monomethyl ester cyclase
MKILLVSAVSPAFKQHSAEMSNLPNGLLSIASVLEQHGHQVQIYDSSVDNRQPTDFLNFDPELIGFSVITGPNLEASISLTREFKSNIPQAITVWGNVCPSVLPEQTLDEPSIDFVVIGAGEFTMLELVERLQLRTNVYDDIKGLAFKKDGRLVINQCRPFIDNLDSLPDPAWHLVDVQQYGTVGINTSRGCAYKCSFCYNGAFGKGYVGYLSSEKILDQILTLKNIYNTHHFRINDDNFTFNRKRLREFCLALIQRRLKITWSCDSRADLNETDIELMSKSGCVAVALGVETGSQRMLDFISKQITVQEMEQTFWLFVKHRIRTTLYIMYGLPTETIDDFNATQEMLRRLDQPYYLYTRYIPFPGSVLYDYCVTHGLVTPPETLNGWARFLERYGTQVNLSSVPEETLAASLRSWRDTYATRRIKFALRHDAQYLLRSLSHPVQLFSDLRQLFTNQNYIRSASKGVGVA